MLDVMFYEAFDEEKRKLSQLLPSSIKAEFTSHTIQEHGCIDMPAKIICIRTQSEIPDEWKAKVEGVLTRSQGYDHISRMFADREPRPQLGFLGGYCSRSVAEHAVLCMLALTKKLKAQIMQYEKFNRDGITGIDIQGRNVLVVGVGQIGGCIVQMSQALNMNVKGVDINPTYNKIEYVDLAGGIKWADVVFCALPLTQATNGLLNYDLLSQNTQGVFLINISRGEITPAEDLLKLLNEKKIKGLSLDVYEDEKDIAEDLRQGKQSCNKTPQFLDMSKRSNVICTPHNAFNTEEAVTRKSQVTVDSIDYFIKNRQFSHSVPEQ